MIERERQTRKAAANKVLPQAGLICFSETFVYL
ncbi:hypothetical protein Riean_1847 [Riemerella anatipestifer ATCC 11845 = DSM 15868]|nr:hypothetical protein Riean_1847 [Riemerella anatipestifer ATCC 11845 = DSM 15868]EFT36236.1 hypothetical protein RAYM_08605 [Riemerella anatipestifer RA-YM]SNV77426.1 Uncharacterised protein [Riemerella anatipestifer]